MTIPLHRTKAERLVAGDPRPSLEELYGSHGGYVSRIAAAALNVAIIAYVGQFVARSQIAVTLPLVQLFNPDIYMPAHHDELIAAGVFVSNDMAPEPVFMAIRDVMPETRTVSPLYRTPVGIPGKF